MLSDRLKLARKRAGLSLRGLAEKMDGQVSAQALGKYERDEMMPSSTVLIALSGVLDVPMDYFLSPTEATLDGIEFRKRASTSARDRARVEAEVLRLADHYLQIEKILDLDSARWDRPCEQRWIAGPEEAEALARELREQWRLGSDPIPNMTQLLERHGIKVLILALPARVSGLTCLVKRPGHEDVPCIVVNRDHNLERRRFTLAHELGHRLMHPDSPEVEKLANRFAGALLAPREYLLAEMGGKRHGLGHEEMILIKRALRISASALLVRLEQVGIIDHSTLAYAFKTLARTWRKREPAPLEGEDERGSWEKPRRFERLCYRALAEGLIGLSRATELLALPVSTVEKHFKGPEYDADRD